MNLENLRTQQSIGQAAEDEWNSRRLAAEDVRARVWQSYDQALASIISELESRLRDTRLTFRTERGIHSPSAVNEWGDWDNCFVTVGFPATSKTLEIAHRGVCWLDSKGRAMHVTVGYRSVGYPRIDRDKNIMERTIDQIRSTTFFVPVTITLASKVSELQWRNPSDNAKIVNAALNLLDGRQPLKEYRFTETPIKLSGCLLALMSFVLRQNS
jgi:hypothetical protein